MKSEKKHTKNVYKRIPFHFNSKFDKLKEQQQWTKVEKYSDSFIYLFNSTRNCCWKENNVKQQQQNQMKNNAKEEIP